MNPLLTTSVYWHFPILIVTVSLVYSATRFEKWDQILREALFWGARMSCFLVGIGVALHLLADLGWWGWIAAAGAGAVALVIYVIYSRTRVAARDHEWQR